VTLQATDYVLPVLPLLLQLVLASPASASVSAKLEAFSVPWKLPPKLPWKLRLCKGWVECTLWEFNACNSSSPDSPASGSAFQYWKKTEE